MIIAESTGNILNDVSQALVCPVNTVGTLGKGLALEFKNRWPKLLYPYRNACFDGTFNRDGIFVHDVEEDKKVVCFPTKRHWRYKSRIEWIDRGLMYLSRDYEKHGITSLAIPAVGCGEGGLEWEMVYNLIKIWLGEKHPLPVTVYLP
jgi:O-acetyl-ADP-ribose deacetylase (regulator of RNase III)